MTVSVTTTSVSLELLILLYAFDEKSPCVHIALTDFAPLSKPERL